MPRGSNNPKSVLTGEGTVPVQSELAGFEQKRVPQIETWAAKYDAKRELANGIAGEMKSIELKLREAMHAHESEIDHQESEDGGEELVYKRGDFNVVVKRGKEKVNVKIGEKSQGDVPTDAGGDA